VLTRQDISQLSRTISNAPVPFTWTLPGSSVADESGAAHPNAPPDATGAYDPASPNWFAVVNVDDGAGTPNAIVTRAVDDALDGCQHGHPVKVGSTLRAVTGFGAWNANLARWQQLCGSSVLDACVRTIQIPVVTGWNGVLGANASYNVEYIAALRLTRLVLQPPQVTISGYLTVERQRGGVAFSPLPGPVLGTALVQ
jgi:hypothetical protein